MHIFVWKDSLVFFTTYCIFLTFYAMTHQQDLELYHYRHHSNVNSNYFVYTDCRRGESKRNEEFRKHLVQAGINFKDD